MQALKDLFGPNFILTLLIIGNGFAVIVGIMLLLVPQRLIELARFMGNKWVSTRTFGKPLDAIHDTDTMLIRYSRTLGVALITGAAFILIQSGILVSQIGTTQGAKVLSSLFHKVNLPLALWESLWVTMLTVMFLGAILALLVGLLAMFRRDILEQISQLASRWVSMRRVLRPLEIPRYGLDNILQRHPRIWGGIITVLATYVLFVLWQYIRMG